MKGNIFNKFLINKQSNDGDKSDSDYDYDYNKKSSHPAYKPSRVIQAYFQFSVYVFLDV